MLEALSEEEHNTTYEDRENYYKNQPMLQNDSHTTITRTKSPDGMSQTILATVLQPYDVIKAKVFACGADHPHPGYDYVLSMDSMEYYEPYETAPWHYKCYYDPAGC